MLTGTVQIDYATYTGQAYIMQSPDLKNIFDLVRPGRDSDGS